MPHGATPSRWCVCQFHHFGCVNYLDFSAGGAAGVASLVGAGVGAGVAGASVALFSPAGAAAGGGLVAPAGTTDRLPGRPEMIVRASEVTMKITAAAVVAFESIVAAPRWPKAV